MPIYKKQRGSRWYLYEQHSVREGKRVRTISRYLGPAGFDAAQDRAYDSAMRQAERDYPEQFQPGYHEAKEKEAKAVHFSQESFLVESASPAHDSNSDGKEGGEGDGGEGDAV